MSVSELRQSALPACLGRIGQVRYKSAPHVMNSLPTAVVLVAMLLNGGPGAFGANQEGISLLISVTYEFIQLIAYF